MSMESSTLWTKLEKLEDSLARIPVVEGNIGDKKFRLLLDVEKHNIILTLGDEPYVTDVDNFVANAFVAICPDDAQRLALAAVKGVGAQDDG